MCGLFGVFKPTHLSNEERRATVEMGMLSFFRGTDSTGISTLTKKKPRSEKVDYTIVKSIDHSIDFFKQERVLNTVYNPKVTSILGHARAATHGTINEINAQPLREGSIVGTHNGVVRKFTPTKNEEDTQSDSRKMYNAIDNMPIEKVLASLYMNDSYALAFYDLEYNTLNFVRNDKRPLYLCKSGEDGTLFWASEEYMIVYAMLKYGLPYEDLKQLPENMLVSIDLITGNPEVHAIKTSTSSIWQSSSYTTYPRTYDPGIVKPGYDGDTQALESRTSGILESHAEMREFMEKTREEYRAGKARAVLSLPPPSNVIPMTKKENDDLMNREATEIFERQLDMVVHAMVREAQARDSESPFRNASCCDNDDTHLDKATYKLRRRGQTEWVSIPTAQALLNEGCVSCNAVSDVEETAFWRDHDEYLCGDCHQDLTIIEYYGHKLNEFEPSDIMLDTHVSMYGG